MLMPKRPAPFRLHEQQQQPALLIVEADGLTPAERLLVKVIRNDRHLREYIERRARLAGLSLREQIKGDFNAG